MHVDILSLFPDYFQGPLHVSIIKRAQEKGLLSINLVDIRAFASGKHAKVDDRPYGGGPGMVLKPEPVCAAIRSVRRDTSYVVYLSPQGKRLSAAKCRELAQKEHLILLCGHYEGVDERVMKEVDEEISIGDFVMTNGCIPAIAVLDATLRFIPGVLGSAESAEQDSFQQGGLFDAPCYTQPDEFEGELVPSVLKSGNHAAIAQWKKERAYEKTARVRPDLLKEIL